MRPFARPTLLATLALVLAGCGGGDDPAPEWETIGQERLRLEVPTAWEAEGRLHANGAYTVVVLSRTTDDGVGLMAFSKAGPAPMRFASRSAHGTPLRQHRTDVPGARRAQAYEYDYRLDDEHEADPGGPGLTMGVRALAGDRVLEVQVFGPAEAVRGPEAQRVLRSLRASGP